uniref:Putative secreted protein n=1 Tax=Anopheles triannulatus TaxID=58253 RepID=A0A2M4B494_9DIPT
MVHKQPQPVQPVWQCLPTLRTWLLQPLVLALRLTRDLVTVLWQRWQPAEGLPKWKKMIIVIPRRSKTHSDYPTI